MFNDFDGYPRYEYYSVKIMDSSTFFQNVHFVLFCLNDHFHCIQARGLLDRSSSNSLAPLALARLLTLSCAFLVKKACKTLKGF